MEDKLYSTRTNSLPLHLWLSQTFLPCHSPLSLWAICEVSKLMSWESPGQDLPPGAQLQPLLESLGREPPISGLCFLTST